MRPDRAIGTPAVPYITYEESNVELGRPVVGVVYNKAEVARCEGKAACTKVHKSSVKIAGGVGAEGCLTKFNTGRLHPEIQPLTLYQLIPSGGPGFIPLGVGRVTERGFLLSETPYFLCRTALASHALQA